MKQLEVQIMGQSYLLGCPEGGDASLLDAVHRVDLAMCKIRDAGKVKARDRIAVLAALNLAFDAQTREAAAAAALLSATPGIGLTRSQDMISTDSARLLALIERLDTAIGEDGQLL